MSKRNNINIIKERLAITKPHLEILDNEYINAKTKLTVKCKIHNTISHPNYNSLQKESATGCLICAKERCNKAKSTPTEENKLSVIRPDLVQYFLNKEDANKIKCGTHLKFDLICPICGTIKYNANIRSLINSGFRCNICSKDISFLNLFIQNVLKELNVDYIFEYMPKWDKSNRRYDFYLSQYNMIIEVNGLQHYVAMGYTASDESFWRQQKIDKEKRDIALFNNIDKYIIIDARKSTLSWLKENSFKELSPYFNIQDLDWNKIYTNSQHSLKLKAWNMYNNGMNTKQISSILKYSSTTIGKWLHIGTEIGKCVYNPRLSNMKYVAQYDLNNNLIKIWDSAAEAHRIEGYSKQHISNCCKGIRKTHAGYIWKFYNDERNI